MPHACCAISATTCATPVTWFCQTKNRRQAEHPPRSGCHTHVARQRNDMRHSSDVVLPNKKPPSGGTPPRSGCHTHVARLAQRHAQQPARDKSGAISHSRAGFAEESARGSVFAEASPGQGVLLKARLSRRNAMKPEAATTARRAPAKQDRSVYKKRAGRRELTFTSFPALFKFARTRARRT